jgi:hypothetical protein
MKAMPRDVPAGMCSDSEELRWSLMGDRILLPDIDMVAFIHKLDTDLHPDSQKYSSLLGRMQRTLPTCASCEKHAIVVILQSQGDAAGDVLPLFCMQT